MKKTPLQQVKDRFGSKEELANQLLGKLNRQADESDEDFARRIRTCSNKQLLRMWQAEEQMAALGGRDAVLDAIVTARFNGKIDADYRSKLARYANSRLLDLHKQFAA